MKPRVLHHQRLPYDGQVRIERLFAEIRGERGHLPLLLTRLSRACIQQCMTKVFTLRMDAELLGKAEARAARLGLDRAKYVRTLIEEDLAEGGAETPRKFASEDLAGMYEGPGQAASNGAVRERLRRNHARGGV